MTRERWRTVADYEGFYEVSNLGRVRSTGRARTNYSASPRVLKPGGGKSGYHTVTLYVEGRRRTRYVHRLVAAAFIPNPKDLPEVNHKDTVRANCAASNLEWMTHAQNKDHAKSMPGYGLKLRAPQVAEIKRRLLTGEHPKQIAVGCPASVQTVKAIKYGRVWKHVAAATESPTGSPPTDRN